MNIITVPNEAADRWEAYVKRCDRTTPGQSYEWQHILRRHYDIEFHPLAAEEAGEIVGILPLYRVRSRKGLSPLISSPYAVNGGLTADSPAASTALLNAAIELNDRLKAGGITFKQYRWPIEGPVKTDANWCNRELALPEGENGMWNRLADRNKTAIEAAGRRKLTLEFPSQRVDVFYPMLLRFMTRLGVPCSSRGWIESLMAHDAEKLAIVLDGNVPLAATMVKPFKWMVSFPFTCLRDNSPETLDAAYFMYWELIRHYAKEGFRVFHSGRMPRNEDVPFYRQGWGGERHTYYYHYYPATGGSTEAQNKRGWKRKLVSACWKFLPTTLAGQMGPDIIARFP